MIDFDEESAHYGKVIKTVPIPPPGNIGNEPHHCHLNSNKTILGCGGLLSLLKGQNGIFFFDVTDADQPAVPVLHQSRGIEHHRRLPAHRERRLPDYADGRRRRHGARPRRRIRRQYAFRRQPLRHLSMFQEWPAAPAARRVQPPWHFRASGSEPDDDLGLHPAHQHPGGFAGAGPARLRAHLGLPRTQNYQDHPTELARLRRPRWAPWT